MAGKGQELMNEEGALVEWVGCYGKGLSKSKMLIFPRLQINTFQLDQPIHRLTELNDGHILWMILRRKAVVAVTA